MGVFGGDPLRVTLFGQSAGGSLTLSHLVSPFSAGLFHAAIIESGFGKNVGFEPIPLDQALREGSWLVDRLGCGDSPDLLSCLRNVSVETIVNKTSEFCFWNPAIDGVQVVEAPSEAIAAGRFHRVPVIVGSTLNDDALGVYLTFGSEKISGLEYAAALTYYFGIGHAYKVSQLYSNISSNFWALSTASTDYNLRCPSRSLAHIWASYNVLSWLYSFSWASPDGTNVYNVSADLRACHGSDLPFVFNHLPNFTKETQQLSDQVMGFWTNFASHLSPNADNTSLFWPKYASDSDLYLNFDTPSSIGSHLGASGPICDLFWDCVNISAKQLGAGD